MTPKYYRLIDTTDLPESLWRQGEGILCLPPELISAWLNLLDRHNLRALTLTERPVAFYADNRISRSFFLSSSAVLICSLVALAILGETMRSRTFFRG